MGLSAFNRMRRIRKAKEDEAAKPAKAAFHPLDHDQDGRKGGSRRRKKTV